MAFMEHLTTKSKDFTQKAKDITEQTKYKNLIKAEEDKIVKLYEILGKTFYENETENVRSPYAEMIQTIHKSEEKIEEYKQKIDGLKSKYYCPTCGAPVTSTTQFCRKCGTKITTFHS